ncbi:phosphosulfolactate synthase [Alicyclobacillus mali]|uniref:Phosphosulfolactate synthase n=1 Tax=Alicyclobacillus mali (ex Roth et al. 2021) TaxID=1123961 RepID=A0ABS0F2S5_9BACL|nr:phosphosulfolactate synthase [Alicyclobacillus mali (ex Roth et al. 2021)]MBF8377591.1 phosphosulfolactate synthase [Alicyclobacillus mali (ex Roth et al. 2021)]MCL6488807.1 phosphosulfolactate synthase [Alicyclobacillus mali (ex Roth et al. 2021)]
MIVPEGGAFSQWIAPPLGARSGKPRTSGITMVIDKGLSLAETESLLSMAAPIIDVLKLGFGTSAVYPEHILRSKLQRAAEQDVMACPGGTLGEVAWTQGVFAEYLQRCRELGFQAMEISDGIIDLPPAHRARAVAAAKRVFPVVITEVGKKLSHDVDLARCAEGVIRDLEAGADYVILEGRESGEDVGIYGPGGTVLDDALSAFIQALPAYARSRVIWEAPKKSQQVELIRRFGPTVNLGNVPPADAIAVECLRLGLRADTFVLALSGPGSQGSS